MDTTASALERALECPGSEVLSRIHRHTDDAERGNSIHAFVRRVVRGVSITDAIVHVADKWRPTCKDIDFAKLVAGLENLRSEHAFAIDVSTGAVRFLGEDIGRHYPLRERTEFAGTEDIGADDGFAKRPVTTDIKTGWEPVTEVAENPQVKFFAARAHLATGANEVEGRIANIRQSGAVHIDRHVFKKIEIEDFLDDLSDLIGRIEAARAQYDTTGTVTVSPGKWCRYCPSKSVCPAKIALAREMSGDLATVSAMLTAMTPEQKSVAWAKAKEIESLLEVVLEGLKDVAKTEPFFTRGGAKIVRSISFERGDFVDARAIELLHQLGATREQIDGCYSFRVVEQVREVKNPDAPPPPKKPRRPRLT